jgi:hypothetical protein
MKLFLTFIDALFPSQSIHDRVREECSGKLKDLLLAVLNAVWPEGI